jgi:hypothetical protein
MFACFGCVVINHQKDKDCKENGPRPIRLNDLGICLLVFVFVVHKMQSIGVLRQ